MRPATLWGRRTRRHRGERAASEGHDGSHARRAEGERAELVARFRKGGTLVYQAALAELLVHATLRRQGYAVEVQPPTGRLRRPWIEWLAGNSALIGPNPRTSRMPVSRSTASARYGALGGERDAATLEYGLDAGGVRGVIPSGQPDDRAGEFDEGLG
jgi:hypothetical protein